MTRLKSCEGCARHVFVIETRCPFCGRELAPGSRSPIFDIRAGMSRAQRYTLVAAVASQTLLACPSSSKSGTHGGTGGMQQGSGGTMLPGTGGQAAAGSGGGGLVQPVYGAPLATGGTGAGTSGTGAGNGGANAGTGGTSGGSGGQGIAVVHYGGIMPPDAGQAGAGDAGEAKDAGHIPVPPYGAIPPLPPK
jgi:hypothetical protein